MVQNLPRDITKYKIDKLLCKYLNDESLKKIVKINMAYDNSEYIIAF